MKKIMFLICLVFATAVISGETQRSISFIPFGNGTGIGIYDIGRDAKLTSFYEHIYKKYDEQTNTENVLKDGLIWGLNDKWLSKAKLIKAGYIDGTGIVRVEKEMDELSIIEYYFMPFSTEKRIIVSEITITNNGEEKEIKPYIYVDGYAGGSSNFGQEKVTIDKRIICEETQKISDNKALLYTIENMEKYSFKQKNMMPKDIKINTFEPDNKIMDAKMLTGVLSGGIKKIKKGESIYFKAVIANCSIEEKKEYLADIRKISEKKSGLLLEEEIAEWNKWHSSEVYPVGIKEDEKKLYLQSTAVIRMGQSRENNKSKGQILASLPPGEWSISWPRDSSYSIVALARTGHFEEAKAGLQFMFDAPGGNFTTPEFIGQKYRISACRYYGDGTEESDYNSQGANIEFDDFGLVLWALSEYVERSGDKSFVEKYSKVINEEIADVIVNLMEEKGYLKADSSIWERHWEPDSHPDGKKHFAYSSINGYNGLRRYGNVIGGDLGKSYIEKAEAIKKGILEHFIDNGIIVQALELKAKGINEYMDAANVEAINFGIVDDETAKINLDAYEKYLKIKDRPGFKRNDDGTWYDDQEWSIIDMRIATAYMKHNKDRSYELIRWITDNSIPNFNLIPELYESLTYKYAGAIPMCGFGAGTYIMAVQDYYGGK